MPKVEPGTLIKVSSVIRERGFDAISACRISVTTFSGLHMKNPMTPWGGLISADARSLAPCTTSPTCSADQPTLMHAVHSPLLVFLVLPPLSHLYSIWQYLLSWILIIIRRTNTPLLSSSLHLECIYLVSQYTIP
ncbi:uncharacterized protein LACBIDRAFT_329010 [Laccaria bicolor S238N-H82]|uniref:Predicted protein n=1 Tax=Laccaria bicolor (strain S238N-H82 / ATCC MYA-4686) TaxID=486041 RepID=B0DGR6_LACBS|nr:uncharacterized protein LACBIDRAFT_329010 [Laccaria bicolor S238N-H82]EDR06318.1 predicted protein [Laccaria bicolor S238N-H82]|eukprot:XP_001883179.1 predicted protein [Laccaria bicolor S238N-H82]